MRLPILFVALLSLGLAACSSSTAYQAADKRGGYGYTETALGKDRYRITFNGNSATDKETVNDYALLRAAELTLQEGYDWFHLVNRDSESKSRNSTSVSGGTGFGGGTSVYQRCGLISCDTVVYDSPTRYSGGVASTTTRTSYSAALEIKMGKGPMPDDAEAYNAQELASTLRRWMNTGNR
ncbi:hypothetical protein NCG89_05400 [Spongiibacter taiwanensis]|uniref:CC0125/CC1285 family lipoprotein n=1 Tax=Spongiibacter taiwanensis TaxID=1748242 RepID=UPI002035FE0A|nr:hypothetical protein [Spongiibacter taiwanensis]USA44216.1 hypothetical protein NCG89_05400 [Spongiibacter taiwanensis]